jgi:hypothetical protein
MMKKVLSSLFIVLCLSAGLAHADGRWGGRWGGGWHGGGDGWFLPALIGGAALGYMVSQPQTVYVQQPPVVYTQPQTVYVQTPPPVTVVPQGEYSGPPPRPVYKEVIEYDPQCNCNVKVQRQVGWQ